MTMPLRIKDLEITTQHRLMYLNGWYTGAIQALAVCGWDDAKLLIVNSLFMSQVDQLFMNSQEADYYANAVMANIFNSAECDKSGLVLKPIANRLRQYSEMSREELEKLADAPKVAYDGQNRGVFQGRVVFNESWGRG